MEQKIFILSARAYSFADEKTGQQRDGISIMYITADNLDHQENPDGSLGYIPCKQSVPLNFKSKLGSVPGWYKGTFQLAASGGKNVLRLADFTETK